MKLPKRWLLQMTQRSMKKSATFSLLLSIWRDSGNNRQKRFSALHVRSSSAVFRRWKLCLLPKISAWNRFPQKNLTGIIVK